MKKLVGYLIIIMGILAGTAQAESSLFYYGVGFSDGSVEVTGNDNRSLGSINITAGLQFSRHLGVELELGSASDDTSSIVTDPLVSFQAVMVKLGWTFDRFGVYVVGGHALMDVASSLNFTQSGTAFGLGMNLFGNRTTSLNLHFLQLGGGAFTTATIGFQHYFGGYR